MNAEQAFAAENAAASLTMGTAAQEHAGKIEGRYVVECFGTDGALKWSDVIDNLVTTAGKNLILDTILAGSSYTASVVIGLKGTGTAAVGDTQGSHAGWSEVGGTNAPAYSSTRKTPSFSAASGGTKATSAAVSFAFTSGGTVAGCFVNINGSSTQDNTTGTLLSAGDFSGGSRTVASSDTLTVTYQLSV